MIARSTLIRMAGAEPSTARAGWEIDHEADGKDASSGSSSFIDSRTNHSANEMIPVLYDWSIDRPRMYPVRRRAVYIAEASRLNNVEARL